MRASVCITVLALACVALRASAQEDPEEAAEKNQAELDRCLGLLRKEAQSESESVTASVGEAADVVSNGRRLMQAANPADAAAMAESKKQGDLAKCIKVVQTEATAHLEGIAELASEKSRLLREAAIAGTQPVEEEMMKSTSMECG